MKNVYGIVNLIGLVLLGVWCSIISKDAFDLALDTSDELHRLTVHAQINSNDNFYQCINDLAIQRLMLAQLDPETLTERQAELIFLHFRPVMSHFYQKHQNLQPLELVRLWLYELKADLGISGPPPAAPNQD